jgi:hypothetical protein
LNLLIVKSPHNIFHNWVRDHDNVVTNQLAQEYKGNTISFYGNSSAGKDNNHGKDNELGEGFGIAKGLAENAWWHQTSIKGTVRRSGQDNARNQIFKQPKSSRGLVGLLPDCNVSRQQHSHQKFYFKWLMDHFDGYVRNKIRMSRNLFHL